MSQDKIRCSWPGENELMIQYHDEEWGVPIHEDRKLFEFMVLDSFQAGLSWQIILNKREGFRSAFAEFDISSGSFISFGSYMGISFGLPMDLIRDLSEVTFLGILDKYGITILIPIVSYSFLKSDI